MGIAFSGLIDSCKVKFDLNNLKNKRLGFDAYNVLFQFVTTIRGIDGESLKNERGEVTSHYSGLFYRLMNISKYTTDITFVFDGVSHELKGKTKEERRGRREVAKENYQKAFDEGNLQDMHKFARQAATIDSKIISESKELILAMGLSYIDAPGEAEAQISYLTRNNLLDYTISQDYDCILFGSPHLLKNVAVSGKKKIPHKNVYVEVNPEIIHAECIYTKLNLTYDKLLWLSLLIGTDFNEKVEGIGPQTAYKLVQKYNSFEEIEAYLKEKGKSVPFNYKEIEDIFRNPNITTSPEIKKGVFSRDAIENILINKAGSSSDRVKNQLDEYLKEREERNKQRTINKWF
ncbi:MAG: hypothetical protein WCF78_02045 [archaeon]